jgi:hypothetical protein
VCRPWDRRTAQPALSQGNLTDELSIRPAWTRKILGLDRRLESLPFHVFFDFVKTHTCWLQVITISIDRAAGIVFVKKSRTKQLGENALRNRLIRRHISVPVQIR